MDIILFGMQGSGKGTQGKILAEKYGLKVFEMGGALRNMIALESDLGKEIKATVEAGNLVSDEIIMKVVENFLSNQPPEQSLLFDGIPRTARQAEELLEHIKGHGRDAFALHIQISEEESVKRLTSRRVCVDCKIIFPGFFESANCDKCDGKLVSRKDDSNLNSIQNRINSFKRETIPVIKDFYSRDRLIEVDGEQAIEDVTDETIEKAGYLFS